MFCAFSTTNNYFHSFANTHQLTMCQFDSKPSFVILASQANATSHSVSFDELESNLPVYSAISPRLPPLYQDRREIDAPTHQSHLYSSILLTSSPTPVLPSICFYESLM